MTGYIELLNTLKERIRKAQIRAALSVNRELVLLYWQIGQEILTRQATEHWGTKVIDRLDKDLRMEFPEMQGFSTRNLKYMRAFAEAYTDKLFVQQAVAQIPWGHNVRILDHVKDPSEREWYIRQTIKNGWSRNILVLQIESGLYRRQGKAISNFRRTLLPPQSDLAHQSAWPRLAEAHASAIVRSAVSSSLRRIRLKRRRLFADVSKSSEVQTRNIEVQWNSLQGTALLCLPAGRLVR